MNQGKRIETEGNLYINPLTDFGFKRIFGDEEIMMDFLNDLIEPKSPITSIEFIDKDAVATNKYERGVIYDLRCKTADGNEIIVEMQKGEQQYFADRILYYLSRSIAPQGYKGKQLKDLEAEKKQFVSWDFNLKPVYGVFFLNFELSGYEPCPLRKIQFTINGTDKVFCDKVRAYTIELPDYRDYKESDCKTHLDYWNYIMTHMETMNTQLPFLNEKPIFNKVASIASMAAMHSDELQLYMDSVDAYRTTMAAFAFSEMKGEERGIAIGEERERELQLKKQEQERISNITRMRSKGLDSEAIADFLDLPLEYVQQH